MEPNVCQGINCVVEFARAHPELCIGGPFLGSLAAAATALIILRYPPAAPIKFSQDGLLAKTHGEGVTLDTSVDPSPLPPMIVDAHQQDANRYQQITEEGEETFGEHAKQRALDELMDRIIARLWD